MHIPVLLKEVIDFLDPKPGEFFIDGTINGGGHAKEILKKISPGGTLLGIDWDRSLIEKTSQSLKSADSEVILVCSNYAQTLELLRNKDKRADGLLLDLGFSTEQIKSSGRGFSFEKDEPLYMTYSESEKPVAAIIRELKENELADIIFQLSGEKYSRKIAKAIKLAGKSEKIISSAKLAEIIRSAVPKNYEKGRIDPATRTFQALRIYANQELQNLEQALGNIPFVLKSSGRAVIISFHSLEDALVKKYFKKFKEEKLVDILTKKPIEPTKEEIDRNPLSRSARLRAIQLIQPPQTLTAIRNDLSTTQKKF